MPASSMMTPMSILLVVPMDLRTPISNVRSVTARSMDMASPTPPMSLPSALILASIL